MKTQIFVQYLKEAAQIKTKQNKKQQQQQQQKQS